MIGTVGRFRATRGFQLESGHVVRAGDSLDLTDPQLIAELLQAGKLEPRDRDTERRIRWQSQTQWSPATDPVITRSGYQPGWWG